jgi:NADH-quinone oxidoreductase subunit A
MMLAAHPYASVLVLILTIIGMVVGMLGVSYLVGPKRRGPVKDETYEAGMPTIGDARRRFNVRFYVVAMMFLLFDVEIVLLWPWVLLLHDVAVRGGSAAEAAAGMEKASLFGAISVFFLILVVGYVYDWGKGVFRWLS